MGELSFCVSVEIVVSGGAELFSDGACPEEQADKRSVVPRNNANSVLFLNINIAPFPMAALI